MMIEWDCLALKENWLITTILLSCISFDNIVLTTVTTEIWEHNDIATNRYTGETKLHHWNYFNQCHCNNFGEHNAFVTGRIDQPRSRALNRLRHLTFVDSIRPGVGETADRSELRRQY